MEGEESDGQQMEALLRWAAEIGISDSPPPPPTAASCLGHSLLVSDFPDAGGRGLAAARDLRRGELILRVPRPALMTSESVMMGDEKLSACVRRHPHLSATQVSGFPASRYVYNSTIFPAMSCLSKTAAISQIKSRNLGSSFPTYKGFPARHF